MKSQVLSFALSGEQDEPLCWSYSPENGIPSNLSEISNVYHLPSVREEINPNPNQVDWQALTPVNSSSLYWLI